MKEGWLFVRMGKELDVVRMVVGDAPRDSRKRYDRDSFSSSFSRRI